MCQDAQKESGPKRRWRQSRTNFWTASHLAGYRGKGSVKTASGQRRYCLSTEPGKQWSFTSRTELQHSRESVRKENKCDQFFFFFFQGSRALSKFFVLSFCTCFCTPLLWRNKSLINIIMRVLGVKLSVWTNEGLQSNWFNVSAVALYSQNVCP